MASLSNPQPKFYAFLSVHKDIRNGFASYVNADLVEASIETFIDKKVVEEEEEEIPASRLEKIEESEISVVIFSLNYASSSWCLNELVKIRERRDMKTQIVLPVFYHVDPSDVRNQRGIFGEKFVELKGSAKYENNLELHQKWEKALSDIANISGWHLGPKTDEAVTKKEIVEHVFRILSYMYPSNDKHLVGVESRTREIESLLHIGSNDIILYMGIWGMCGIGKTTIAKAVFNKNFREFDEYFFAENVSEELESCNGVSSLLQQNLLSAILKDQNVDINSELTRQRLCLTKVLIVFDDVKSPEQIKKLIGDLDCFRLGSRIIITTRDKEVLEKCRVEKNTYKVKGRVEKNTYEVKGRVEKNIYKVEGLSHHEALQAFSWYAFDKKYPISGYHMLSDKVVKYAKGVPLALRVWGDTLSTTEDQLRVWGDASFSKEKVWKSATKKLQRVLDKKIQDELIVSYDGLDKDQKDIFLDIACFLKWETTNVVVTFFDVGGYGVERDITTLINRCLISVSNNKIIMHNLFQQMGREIIQKSSKYPEERNRLWYYEDIHTILEENTGTREIEGICFDMSEVSKMELSDPNVFKEMRNLRFLKIYNSYCEKDKISKIDVPNGLKSVFSKLRYLCWHGSPLNPLQLTRNLHNLVVLDMPYSTVEQLWTDALNLVNLKRINLSHSKNLHKILDLSGVKNLESLILEGCTSLSEISSSIQCLNNLVNLNLRHCTSLHSLPTGIYNLKSLQHFDLSGCWKLDGLLEGLGNLYID